MQQTLNEHRSIYIRSIWLFLVKDMSVIVPVSIRFGIGEDWFGLIHYSAFSAAMAM